MLKRISAAFLLIAVGFAIGVFVGYKFVGVPWLWMGAVGESFMAEQYAMTLYLEGDYPEATEALEAYIAYLERVKPSEASWNPGESPWLDSRGLNLDKTLAWIRLALLHERNANPVAAETAWQRVDLLATQGSWEDSSRENLRKVVVRLDGNPVSRGRAESGNREESELPGDKSSDSSSET
jgi:hypothetical protein